MTKCPLCGHRVLYVGFNDITCAGRECANGGSGVYYGTFEWAVEMQSRAYKLWANDRPQSVERWRYVSTDVSKAGQHVRAWSFCLNQHEYAAYPAYLPNWGSLEWAKREAEHNRQCRRVNGFWYVVPHGYGQPVE